MLSAQVIRAGEDAPATHRVINISTTGARIAKPGTLRPGERVSIAVGQAAMVVAKVVRIDAKGAALRFDEEIDLDAARRRRSTDFVPMIAAGWMTERERVFR
jgi:hypothetical protein